jgi:hypothetical protein
MTPEEFKKRLDQLREVIMRAVSFYKVWLRLQYREDTASWSLNEQNRMLDQFRGFFTPVAIAMRGAALLEFAKVFDQDDRTASLFVLLKAARRQPSLVPARTPDDLRGFDKQLKMADQTLQSLKDMRDQRLAHTDANPVAPTPLPKKDLDLLATTIEKIFNGLSAGHDGNVFSWEYMLRTSDRDTTAVLRILMDEVEQKQSKYEEEMVRIVLEEIQRRETVLARRLDKEEMRSIKREFGLTEGQAQRVDDTYGSTEEG